MGNYADLFVGTHQVASFKSGVPVDLMTVFTEADRCRDLRPISARSRFDPQYLDEDESPDELEPSYVYATAAGVVADRLDVLGFTIARTEAAFARGVATLQHAQRSESRWMKSRELTALRKARFASWLGAMASSLRDGRGRPAHDWRRRASKHPVVRAIWPSEGIFGFPDQVDLRYGLRAAVSLVGRDEIVSVDYSDLVLCEYVAPDDRLTEPYVEDFDPERPFTVEAGKIIVLTEGTTDRRVIERCLRMRKPHLFDYFVFPGLSSEKPAGGAGNLANTIRAFVSARITNPVVALFDNDTAARSALRGLERLKLPPCIKIVHIPRLDIAMAYPSKELPAGTAISNMNVNGLAVGIEMCFGRSVLTREDGHLTPVVLGKPDQSGGDRQGELDGKRDLHARFHEILNKIERGEVPAAAHDWTEMDALLHVIVGAFGSD